MFRLMKVPGILGLALLVTACAKSPDKIAAATISNAAYLGQACSDLTSDYTRTDTELAELEIKQRNAARADVAALIVVGIPVAWMYKGNKADEIANRRGELAAIEGVAADMACELPARVTVEPVIAEEEDSDAGTTRSEFDLEDLDMVD